MRMPTFLVTGIGVSFCLAFHQPIQAAIWYVDASVIQSGDGMAWESAFKMIQEGIDAASEGDTVMVGPGTYRDQVRLDGKAIELKGCEAPSMTVLEGPIGGGIVRFDHGETEQTVMSGFTIRGGRSWGDDGGGIVCVNSSPAIADCIICQNASTRSHWEGGRGAGVFCSGASPTFSRCVFGDNDADYEGGGIYAENCPAITLTNCVIRANRATYGGGISSEGSGLTLVDCEIVENSGAVACYETALDMVQCKVACNTSDGISCYGGSVTMARCLFIGNSVHGEDSSVVGFWWCQGEVSDCLFLHNTAEGAEGVTIGSNESVTFTNCVFLSNFAPGVAVIRLKEAFGRITSCTISENSLGDKGAAMDCIESSPEIANSILWGNGDLDLKLDEASEETLVLHCDIGTSSGTFRDGGGNISCDPLLVDPANGNFHLLHFSPCRNAGENSYAPENDIDGEARPVEGVSDIGADEFKDSDFDSLPDYWEIKAGLDPQDNGARDPDNGANGDPDGDGVSNADEYLRGTAPRVRPTILYVSEARGDDEWNGKAPSYEGDSVGPKRTISAAIESGKGDWLTVRIEQGTYRERVRLESFVTLEGGWSPEFSERDVEAYTVVLDGERQGNTVTCDLVRDITLDGLKITNGSAHQGGGILCSASSLALRRCRITDNQATWSGGGIYAAAGSSLTLEECRIAENVSAWYGGGATFLEGSSAVFRNCEISANEAAEDVALGTGLYCENAGLTLDRCLVSENFGFFAHGTVYCVDSDVLVDACIFTRNSGESGCAVYCDGCDGDITRCLMRENGGGVCLGNSRVIVSECTMEGNHTGVGMHRGGESVVADCLLIGNDWGIYCGTGTVTRCQILEGDYGILCEGGTPTIRDCLISRNTEVGIKCVSSSPTIINCVISGNLGEEYNRGGICCRSSSFPKIVNCTVWGNRGNGEGGGILCVSSGFRATNCILWGNSPFDLEVADGACSATLSHCAVGELVGSYMDGGGNVRGDPKLLNPWRGDFHLRPDSPCIDAGTYAEAPRNDFYGDLRPFGVAVDVGADEFVDSDGDSLADYWETNFGLDPNDDGGINPDHGATGDPDNDFASNLEELLRGTGPMAAPTTLYVDAENGSDDWDGRSPIPLHGSSGPKATLGAAISCLGGDLSTVYVSAGTYSGNLKLSSWTTISGGWRSGFTFRDPGGFKTIVRSTGDGSVVTCVGVDDVTLDGLTITGGSAREGGGLRGIDCDLTVTHCIIQNNRAEVRGGGMCITGTSEVSISGSKILANHAGYGGGIELIATSGLIRGCQIEGNRAEEGTGGGLHLYNFLGEVSDCQCGGNEARSRGGGMACSTCSPRITDCTFSENMAEGGGGVYTARSEATFTSCRIVSNSARGGGGVRCLGLSPTLINCEVSGNTAEYGGGIYGYVCNPRLENCRIFNNQADSGGGIRLDFDHWLGIPVLINCLIFSNSAPEASAMYAYDCNVGLTNCTVSGNRGDAALIYGAQYPRYRTPSIVNTIVWGNGDGGPAIKNGIPQLAISHSLVSSVDGDYEDVGGNISGDPLFVSAPEDDFHLLPESPCIDAGSTDAASAPSTDMDGELRPFGTSVDIGADEYVDQDFDDLPDYWEIERFAHLWFNDQDDVDEDELDNAAELRWLTDPNNPDTDADGRCDGHEVAAGTDPTDPQSLLQVLGIALTVHVVQIEFSSVPGRTYRLLVSQDLIEWNPLGDLFIASQGISRITDAPQASKIRFYKIQVLRDN